MDSFAGNYPFLPRWRAHGAGQEKDFLLSGGVRAGRRRNDGGGGNGVYFRIVIEVP